jgi:hypothetical protein
MTMMKLMMLMMKREPVPSQNRATATINTEEFFLKTQYLYLSCHISREVRGEQEIGGQRSTIRWSQLGFIANRKISILQTWFTNIL